MKTVISYVSGSGGDFVVNCCNQFCQLPLNLTGSVIPSATTKEFEDHVNNIELIDKINSIPYQYIGSHEIDRLLKIPVGVRWLVVPSKEKYKIFSVRDAITRATDNLMDRYGKQYTIIHNLVTKGKISVAVECYLNCLLEYNWTTMQMRLVQPTNKVDISNLLTPVGIEDLINQLPELKTSSKQCIEYHRLWIDNQLCLQDNDWVQDTLEKKICNFIEHCESNKSVDTH